LISSALSDDDINTLFRQNSPELKKNIQNLKTKMNNNINRQENEEIKVIVNEYFNIIRQNLENQLNANFDLKLTGFYSEINRINEESKPIDRNNVDSFKPEMKKLFKKIEKTSHAKSNAEYIKNTLENDNDNYNIDIITVRDDNENDNDNRIISVSYPKFFINVRGHNLSECFENGIIQKKIIDNFISNGLEYMPNDLVNVFDKLHRKVTEIVKEVI
jgi:hypothetical protein